MFKLQYDLAQIGDYYCFAVTHQEGEAPEDFIASNGLLVQSVACPEIANYALFIRGVGDTTNSKVTMIERVKTKYTLHDYQQALKECIEYANRFDVTPENIEKWYQEGRLLKTRNGQSMRIIHIRNSHQEYPIVGIIDCEGEEILETFTNELQPFADSHKTRETDIIGFWEEKNV